MTGELIEVVLVDDQTLVRSGFRMILETEEDLLIVGEAADGAEALRVVRDVDPTVVLMDIQMPGIDGIEATRRICETGGDTKVLVLTTFERDDYVFAAIRAGASGFLLKNAPPSQLVDAVRVVAAGDSLLSPSVTRRIIDAVASGGATTEAAADQALEILTERERDVLRLMARGLSNLEIAAELVLGETTIKTHVRNILTKLDARDRVQAVVWAFDHGVRG